MHRRSGVHHKLVAANCEGMRRALIDLQAPEHAPVNASTYRLA
jgi:hypothetical protein